MIDNHSTMEEVAAPFGVRREDRDGAVVVHVAGEVDLITAPALDETLLAFDGPEPARLVLNLTDVTFMASVGLALLMKHHQRRRDAGATLIVVAGGRTVRRAIDMTGLTTLLTLAGDLSEALGDDRADSA